MASQKNVNKKVHLQTTYRVAQNVKQLSDGQAQQWLLQAPAAPTPKRRKTTQEPAATSMDAPLLGMELVETAWHALSDLLSHH